MPRPGATACAARRTPRRCSTWRGSPRTSPSSCAAYNDPMTAAADFVPLAIAVLTVSDSRTLEHDSSGQYLADAIVEAGHRLAARALLPDNRWRMRAQVAAWIADDAIDGV